MKKHLVALHQLSDLQEAVKLFKIQSLGSRQRLQQQCQRAAASHQR
jgi:hypothetical protein